MIKIAAIVEGRGEVDAVPKLIAKVLRHLGEESLTPARTYRLNRAQFEAAGKLEGFIRLAKNEGAVGVVLLCDSDDAEWNELESKIAGRSFALKCVAIGVAVKEYEAWLLASLNALRTSEWMKSGCAAITDPERPRDAKGALASRMSVPYKPTVHQAHLTSLVDIDAARQNSPSFDRFYEACRRLVECVKQETSTRPAA